MLKGLYTSIYGPTDIGIFDPLYSRYGSSPPVKRMDVRLGEYGQESASGFFSQDIAGFPLWLVGIGLLGFSWAYRRKRKKQSSRRR